LKAGASAVTVAAIAGVAIGAMASPAFAATSRPNGLTAPAAAPGLGGPAVGAPVLAAPALGATAPLAAPPLNDTELGKFPLANPAGGAAGVASPLAATAPAPAPSHPQPPRPTASPASGPAKPASAQQAGNDGQSASAQQAAPSKPYQFYDSVEPQAIPAGAEVATYATGAHPIPTSAVAGRKHVLWIDTLATDPQGTVALDIEPGCATPSQVPGWVAARVKAHPGQVAILYMSLSEWPQVQSEVASLPASTRSLIRWWVADPTGTPHIVPGSSATQWYWGSSYDISLAEPNLEQP